MIPADPQQLPDDVDALKAMIAAAHAQKALADQERLALEATIAAHQAEIAARQAEITVYEAEIAAMRAAKTADQEKIARLESIVAMLRRAQYGTRSEKLRIDPLDAEPLAFVFDELETGLGEIRAERNKRAGTAAGRGGCRDRSQPVAVGGYKLVNDSGDEIWYNHALYSPLCPCPWMVAFSARSWRAEPHTNSS